MITISTYHLKSKRNRKGEAPIYHRVTGLNKEVNLSTSVYIHPKDWNSKSSTVKSGHERSVYLNSLIKNSKEKISKTIDTSTLFNTKLTANKLKELLSNSNDEKPAKTILFAFDKFIEINSPTYAKGTIRHYKADRTVIEKFLKNKVKDINKPICDVTSELLTDYSNYLLSVRKNKVNTIAKHIVRLKAIVNMALKFEWIDKDNTKSFKIKHEPTFKVILSVDEIKRLAHLNLSENKRNELVRDLFLLMTYTGLSYSDMQALNPSHIETDNDIIRITRKKSKEPCIIPILPYASNILKSYKNNYSSQFNGTCFPKISNEEMNRQLKKITEMASINKKITCHNARHTFACISLDNNIPIETIARVMGHSKTAQTSLYAKVSSQKIEIDYKKLNNVFG